jgi:hypothetical protein
MAQTQQSEMETKELARIQEKSAMYRRGKETQYPFTY